MTLFLATFLYVGYLFLAWGQAAVAELPDMPPLALPQLVRPAAASAAAARPAAGVLWQPAPQQTPGVEPLPSGRITVLVMGVDNRPGETVARTDSIILLTINPRAGSAGMLSLPRDLWVQVPALGRSVKINTVHVLGEINKFPGGGPGLLRETITEFLGYPIDYYVRLNFDGFRQIVDLVGGVDIDVPREIRDDTYPDEHYGFDPLYIPAGRQHMDGALALKYARTRHVDSDYGRARRQQQVIMAIKDKITQPGQLAALLPRLPGLMLALANSIQTDMPMERVISLARLIDRVELDHPTSVVVDSSMGTVTTDPTYGYILVPDMNKVRAAAAAVFADATEEQPAAELTRQQLQAEAGRIVVKNGSQEEGLAARTAAALTADGFNVVAVGNADRADYAQTWLITHGDVAPVTREALVDRFAIPPDRIRSEPPSDQADLTLILGSDQAQK